MLLVIKNLKQITGGTGKLSPTAYMLLPPVDDYNTNLIDENAFNAASKAGTINLDTLEPLLPYLKNKSNTLLNPILRYFKSLYKYNPLPVINSNTAKIPNLNAYLIEGEYYRVVNYLRDVDEWNGGIPATTSNNFGFNALNNGLIVANKYVNFINEYNSKHTDDIRTTQDAELWAGKTFKLPTTTTLNITELNTESDLSERYVQSILSYYTNDKYNYEKYFISLYFMYITNRSILRKESNSGINYELYEILKFVFEYRTMIFWIKTEKSPFTVEKYLTYRYEQGLKLDAMIERYNTALANLSDKGKLKPITPNLLNEVLF